MQLNTKFDHKTTENNKYNKWLASDIFKADTGSDKTPFTVILPPPNVTGKLHLGHAWDGTLQDILVRYKKMQGFEALWLPGMDHAGIATQAKVDERLALDGISRHDIGRAAFMEKAWEWKEEYAQIIRDQWGMMGFALDYSKEKFTLDSDVNKSVNKVFVDLYNQGLIFRGHRITNWDPKAQTALSDIEVIHKEVEGKFYHFKYEFTDGSGFLQVATTRPETCFGDVALAINPLDERVSQLEGKFVQVPGIERVIPIIVDEYVEMDFGTGVVKITPAHDPNDYLVGKRHDLEMLNCMNLDGSMNDVACEFQGQDRFVCRENYVAKLSELGLVVKIEDHVHNVGHSERTGVVVEPILSKQWYVKMDSLAHDSLENQKGDEKVNFVPERFEDTFSSWMENIQDWCISRQLWWGHQIPAWYHNQTGEVYVGEEAPADSENYTRDEDVLDTWFSSALWPFSTTIWSDNKDELEKFYPSDVLVTGYDIIFFWVARMMFQSLKFTGQSPFSDVLIHGLIRGEDGRKMSKSLGNGIDPIDVIETHGADALRFFLTTNSTPGQDLRYSTEKMDSTWNFINKVWNISRYVLMNTSDIESTELSKYETILDSADTYILTKLDQTISQVNTMMDRYEFGEVSRSLYNFIWDDFASWYVEVSKVSLLNEDENIVNKTKTVLRYVNIAIIKMLHPFMPFVTDEIYTQIDDVESVLLTTWPEVSNLKFNNDKVAVFEMLKSVIVSTRTTRQENDIKPSHPLNVYLDTKLSVDDIDLNILKSVGRFACVNLNVEIKVDVLSSVLSTSKVSIATDGAIDNNAKLAKINDQIKKILNEVTRSSKMLSNEKFVARASSEKLEEEKTKAINYINQYEALYNTAILLDDSIKFDQVVSDMKNNI